MTLFPYPTLVRSNFTAEVVLASVPTPPTPTPQAFPLTLRRLDCREGSTATARVWTHEGPERTEPEFDYVTVCALCEAIALQPIDLTPSGH